MFPDPPHDRFLQGDQVLELSIKQNLDVNLGLSLESQLSQWKGNVSVLVAVSDCYSIRYITERLGTRNFAIDFLLCFLFCKNLQKSFQKKQNS